MCLRDLFHSGIRSGDISSLTRSGSGCVEGRNLVTESTTTPGRSKALSTLRLAELQALAAELGIQGTAKMRKSDLATAIRAARDESSGGGARSGGRQQKSADAPAKSPAPAAEAKDAKDAAPAEDAAPARTAPAAKSEAPARQRRRA